MIGPTLVVCTILLLFQTANTQRRRSFCVDDENNSRYCQPTLENIAKSITPNVTSQCGYGEKERYCFMTTTTSRGFSRVRCFMCDASRFSGNTLYTTLLPERMTDSSQETFWASATTYTDQTVSRSPVNVTILFGRLKCLYIKYDANLLTLKVFNRATPRYIKTCIILKKFLFFLNDFQVYCLTYKNSD